MKRATWCIIACVLLAGCGQPEPPRVVEVTREVTSVVTSTPDAATPVQVAEAPSSTATVVLMAEAPSSTAAIQPRVAPSATAMSPDSTSEVSGGNENLEPTQTTAAMSEPQAATATSPESESGVVAMTQPPEATPTDKPTPTVVPSNTAAPTTAPTTAPTATPTTPGSVSEPIPTERPRRLPETPTPTAPSSQGEPIPRIITPTTPSRLILTRIVGVRVTPLVPVLLTRVVPRAVSPLVVTIDTPRKGATLNRSLTFRVTAYDPAVGNQDGAGIERVEMFVIDAEGKTRHKQTELHAVYCLFGGTDEACAPFEFAARRMLWPNGQPIVPGVHTLRAVVFAKSGATATIEITVTLVASR